MIRLQPLPWFLAILAICATGFDDPPDFPRAKPLEPGEAVKSFRVQGGFQLDPIAVEPLVMDPVAAAYDEDGRLFVVEMSDYPHVEAKNDKPFAREDRRRLFAIGNRLWHSDSSFKVTPAKYSLLRAVSIPSKGGNTQFADMRAAYDNLPDHLRKVVEGLSCHYDIMASRAAAGFYDQDACWPEASKRRLEAALSRGGRKPWTPKA